MHILLYAKPMAGPGRKLHQALQELVGPEPIEVVGTIAELACRLYPFGFTERTAVFLAADRDQLLAFFSIAGLLQKLRSILVLPDREPETLKMGYLLRPRFISFVDSGFFEVRAVLGRILENAAKESAWGADKGDEAGLREAVSCRSRNPFWGDLSVPRRGAGAAA